MGIRTYHNDYVYIPNDWISKRSPTDSRKSSSSALSSVLNLGLDQDDVWLNTMPLFHISGFSILVRSVLYGVEVRLYDKFDAVKAASEIQQWEL